MTFPLKIMEKVYVDESTQTFDDGETQRIIHQIQMDEQIKQNELLQNELNECKRLVKSLQDIINVLIEYDDSGPIQRTNTKERHLPLPYKVYEKERNKQSCMATQSKDGSTCHDINNVPSNESTDMTNRWLYTYHTKPDFNEFLNCKCLLEKSCKNQEKKKNLIINNSYENYSSFSKLTASGSKLFILLVGDSMIKHVTGQVLKKHCSGVDFMVRAMKKGKIKHVKRFITDALDMMKPDYVFIHVTKDDVTSGRTLAMIKADMEDLITYILCLRKKPIISMMVIRNDENRYKVNVVNDMLRTLCLKHKVRYVQHKNIRSEHLHSDGIQLRDQYGQLFRENLLFCFNDVLQKETAAQNTD